MGLYPAGQGGGDDPGFELALLLSIKRDRMTMAAIGGLAVFTGLMILFQLLFGSPLEVALTGGLRMLVMTMAFFVYAGGDAYPGYCPDAGGPFPPAL
ncbi:MAG: hypothetical protein ACLR2G_12555 [Phascolarctobacterium faecium]